MMRRAKFALLHVNTLGRVEAPEQAALVAGDDVDEACPTLPSKPPIPFDDAHRNMPFTPLARHRGELLPPGWGPHPQHESEPAATRDGTLAERQRALAAAASGLVMARLRRLRLPGSAPRKPLKVDLDVYRLNRLRQASLRQKRSCEDIVVEAIDRYLEKIEGNSNRS